MPKREFKPLPWFKTETQIRHSLPALQEMAASLKEHGQLQDVAALCSGTLIYGNRRFGGASLAKMEGLWCQVYEEALSPLEIKVMRAVENIQREPLTPFELSCLVKGMVDEGLDQKTVATRLSKGATFVTRYLYPFKIIPAGFEAFKAGAIGITDCEAMAKAESPEEQHRLLEAKFGGATREDIVRQVRRRPEDKVQVSRIRFPLPGGVTITLVGQGLAMDIAIDSLMEGAKAMKKGQAEGLDAKTFQAAMACKAKGG